MAQAQVLTLSRSYEAFGKIQTPSSLPASNASSIKEDNTILPHRRLKEKGGYRYEDTKNISNVKILSPSDVSERPCF